MHPLLQIDLIRVDSNESSISPAEGNLVCPIVPPSFEFCIGHVVPEPDHTIDLQPAVFADPAVATGLVRVDDWGEDGTVACCWWTSLEVVEGKGTHDTWGAVGMGQHERDRHLVK